MHSPILVPVVALIAWTLVMWVWLYATRIPAMRKAGLDATKQVGTTGRTYDGVLPDQAQWKAHNYNHLMEQPTLFYAVCIVLALIDFGGGLNSWIAWGYVGLRIVHSLIQVTVNRVLPRFIAFAMATLCLIALTLHAAMAMLHHH